MIFVVLPLVIAPLFFAGLTSALLARNGITGVATQFLQFKAEQVATYAGGQWQLLVENGFQERDNFRKAAIDAVASFAAGVIRTETELIFAIDGTDSLRFMVGGDQALAGSESPEEITGFGRQPRLRWGRFTLGETSRVSFAVPFEPMDLTIYVTEREDAFYRSVTRITQDVALVLGVSVAAAIVLLVLFSGYLTRPLQAVAEAMTEIFETSNLSKRVEVLYGDETGKLAHTFNLMTDQLERSYEHIKTYALQAASSEIKERKTRTMFQKYVPSDVIEQFFASPEKMLVGDARFVSILFSDIRDFTAISEKMEPTVLVETLNRFFTVMVEAIMAHEGTVDKYIGDAIMALFGAPAKRDDDAKRSVDAALDMVDSLKEFNLHQHKKGLPPFRIGIGLNYGIVTVGNIGSEKKLDYTVIGDAVNVSSRLQELTKQYRVDVIVSETVHAKAQREVSAGRIQSRLLDTVRLRGRAEPLRVYAIARSLPAETQEAWGMHNRAMERFYRRDFDGAKRLFDAVCTAIPGDAPASAMRARCSLLVRRPPDTEWNGVVEMTQK
jgi:class 3 adenylate cyclase/HAMP domain-containing protein